MKTTLNQIHAVCKCERGWKAMLNHLGKTKPDDDFITMNTVLDAVGLTGALWAIRTRTNEGGEQEKQQFKEFCDKGASEDEIRLNFIELFGD